MGQDPATGQVVEDPQRQAELAFENTRTLLETAGMSTDDIVQFFVWVKRSQVPSGGKQALGGHVPRPAQPSRTSRHCASVAGNMVVQLEVMAVDRSAHGNKPRQSFEIPGVAHSGGASPGFIPFGSVVGNVLCSGGTFGRDAKMDKMGETAEEQAALAFENTRTLLDTAGFTPDEVAHLFVWVKDRKYQESVNKAYGDMFPDQMSRPARHVLIGDLPGEMLVQIDMIAVKGGKRESIHVPGVTHASGGGE